MTEVLLIVDSARIELFSWNEVVKHIYRLSGEKDDVDHTVLVHVGKLHKRHCIGLLNCVVHVCLDEAIFLDVIKEFLNVNLEVRPATDIHLRQENIGHAIAVQIDKGIRMRLRNKIIVRLEALRVLLWSEYKVSKIPMRMREAALLIPQGNLKLALHWLINEIRAANNKMKKYLLHVAVDVKEERLCVSSEPQPTDVYIV